MMRIAFLLLLLAAPALAQERVSYEIAFPNAVHHEAEVSATFAGVPVGKPLEVRMARTSPGRYALHEFAKNVYSVKAFDGRGRALTVTQPNLHQWNVGGHDGTVRVTYTLFGDRADGTYTGIDNTHAHLNIPATFVWARGMENAPVRVVFRKPVPGWRIATQLRPNPDSTVFTAPNLQYFMDSPTEISPFSLRSWQVRSGARPYTIHLAVHHAGTEREVDAYAEMARKVVDEQIAVFGEAPRFDYGSYTFIACYLPHVAGDGMEHRNSTVLTSTRPLSTGALANLGTLSHEFFHAWNVERIRPRSLEPFDFEEANVSGELWFAEGFTSYYTPLFPRRAGITSDDEYAASLSGTLNTVINAPGRQFFSPVEMSMQAPFVDAAASIDPQNRQNTFVSYYTWGSAIGLGLDLTLRTRFQGVTLDDYMRAMWREYGRLQDTVRLAPQKPYTLADLRRVLGEVTRDPAFANQFFHRYIEGREVVDYENLLGRAGLLLRKMNAGQPWHGAVLQDREGLVFIGTGTLIGTPMYRAGLDRGDRILSVDGKPVASSAEVQAIIAARRPGDSLPIEWEQRGETRRANLVLAEDPQLEVVTFEKAGRPVSPAMQQFRSQWLASRASSTPSSRP
ncbi:MAG: PDZ domain-containing protein [Gemmatimonadota bacterium]|nr:PDZ domain-containing protein [Gemmatimonadota bacterium]